jgi:hypothetical protein
MSLPEYRTVERAQLGPSFIYPGEPAIYYGSSWRISRRPALLGEHKWKSSATNWDCLVPSFRFWRKIV